LAGSWVVSVQTPLQQVPIVEMPKVQSTPVDPGAQVVGRHSSCEHSVPAGQVAPV
jgi:hypothetical protein